MTKTTSNRLGIITFISSIILAFIYDWKLATILLLFFVSYRTDMVMYVQDQIDSLFENVKQ
jgi:ABC-type multidrug transport system fused ATPase/permease subunit